MGANPYFNPDDDADILEDPPTTTPTIPASDYIITGPNGQELPKELQDALGQYIDLGQFSGNRVSPLPLPLRAMSGMLDFFADLTLFRTETPLLTALADVVDRISEGLLREYYELHDAERRIVTTSIITKFTGAFLNVIEPNDSLNYQDEIYQYVALFLEVTEYMKQCAITTYRLQCEKLDIPIDNVLIETGTFETRSWTQRVGMLSIPALEDKDDYTP